MTTVVVLAKRPVAGRVKTRLSPPLTPGQAADVAAAALTDTLTAVDSAGVRRRVLCFAGPVLGWLRPGWGHRAQCEGSLDVRLADAFAAARGPAVVIGMDTPQLTADLLESFVADRYDACLGPTTDGGFWAIGLADPRHARAALLGIPMSTGHTFAAQLARLRRLRLRVQVLPRLVDVDTADDARTVAAQAPHSRFAAAWRAATAGAA